jgi:uncharacterized protein (DUF2267 family)
LIVAILQDCTMSRAGLDAFDKTLQTTHIWLNELMQEIGPDRQVAWHVLGVVLRAIRDRIPLGLAVHLGSQLPILVRATYYEQWRAPGEALENPPRSLDEFLQPIGAQLSNIRPVNVRKATAAVFGILSRHVNRGQIENVREAMPQQIRALWPDSPEAPDVRPRRRYRGEAARDDGRNQRQTGAKRTSRKVARKRRTTRKAVKKRTATTSVRTSATRKRTASRQQTTPRSRRER